RRPRSGNELAPLVDGAAALPAIARAIEAARTHVHLAGWYFSPSFQLEDRGESLRELLAETAERVDVRLLSWAGAPLPLFHPDRKEVRATVRGARRRHAHPLRPRRTRAPDALPPREARDCRPLPRGDFSLLEAFLAALRGAERYVYLRPGGHARPARVADRRGRRRRTVRRRLALPGRRPAACVCPREGRHRRRPLAHDRLGQPERALALRRHRDDAIVVGEGLATALPKQLWAEHTQGQGSGLDAPGPDV